MPEKLTLSVEEEKMLFNFYDKIIESSSKTKITVPLPDVKVQNKKTFIFNFRTLCFKINREENLLLDFLKKEIGSVISISENGELVISNILRQPQIESLIKRFIITYVQCTQCKSLGTTLSKKAGKTSILCNSCKANYTVNY